MSLCFWSRVVESVVEKLNTWENIEDLGVTEGTVTTTEWMYTFGPLDRSATGLNNAIVMRKK